VVTEWCLVIVVDSSPVIVVILMSPCYCFALRHSLLRRSPTTRLLTITCIDICIDPQERVYRLIGCWSGAAGRQWAFRRRNCATAVSARSRTVFYCASWTSRGTNAVYSAVSACSHSTGHAISRTVSSTANPTTNGPSPYFSSIRTALCLCLSVRERVGRSTPNSHGSSRASREWC